MYAPLKRYVDHVGMKVGVIGVGGLGHLAIQFAKAMGCELTAISSTPEKEEEARKFGSDDFILAGDPDAMKRISFGLDLLLYTSHSKDEWTSLVNSLNTKGRLVVIGFPDEPVMLDPFELVVHQMSITGSLIGNRSTMQEMLIFAQDHQIKPEVELMPMDQVNEAIRKVKANEARYRIVLVREIT